MLRQNHYSDPSLRPPREEPPPCHCRPETGCDHNCMNRQVIFKGKRRASDGIAGLINRIIQLFMECAPGKCPSLAEGQRFCSNMAIQERRFHPTEVFKVMRRP